MFLLEICWTSRCLEICQIVDTLSDEADRMMNAA
jgi:hypothetical protein